MENSWIKAWDYFDLLDENAQSWDKTEGTKKPKPIANSKGGLYLLKEEDDVNSKIAKLTRKIEAMEIGKVNMDMASEKDDTVWHLRM